MTNVDEEIKAVLGADDKAFLADLEKDDAMPDMVVNAFRTNMRGWMIFAWVQTFVLVVLTFWCGYEFIVATELDRKMFWGLFTILGFFSTGMMKMWVWLEMSRVSIIREIKRLELTLSPPN